MNDQEFDAFFRQAAEQHRVSYNPSSWDKMRKKLRRTTGNSSSSTKKILGLALLLILSGALGTALWYQTLRQVPETAESETEITKRNAIEETILPTAPERASEASRPGLPEETVGKEEDKQPSAPAQENQSVNSAYLYQPSRRSASSWMQPGGVEYMERNGVRPGTTELYYPSVLPLEVEQADTEEVLPPVKKPLSPRWRISLGMSPDISAIDLGEANQVGSKIAVGLEYFIVPRLSIQTGVIFSNKVYSADGESYKPYPGYWKKYALPNTIDAQCDVLDIPVNLRYYALNLPRSRFFLSSGLSSYLMVTEDYIYRYWGGYGKKPYNYEHHERNENQHYFKVANLSVGYERALSKRWALQVEPFVKIPVAGVGFGNIKLSTTGLFVALNYRLR